MPLKQLRDRNAKVLELEAQKMERDEHAPCAGPAFKRLFSRVPE